MVYIIFASVALPLVLLLIMAKGKQRNMIGFIVIGIICAILSFEINSLTKYIYNVNEFDFRVFVSPITEEVIKFIPILFFAILVSRRRDIIMQFSMALGIGFAILENIYLLVVNAEFVNIFWALMRGLSTGLMHGMTTVAVSYGISFIKKKKLFYTGILGLLCLAFTYHGIYNLLVESGYGYIGFMLPIFTYIFMLNTIKKVPVH